MKDQIAYLTNVTKQVLDSRKQDRVDILAAGVTYFTLFALAPLLILLVYIASIILQRGNEVREQLIATISGSLGSEAGQVIENLIQNQLISNIKDIAGVIAIVLVLVAVDSWVSNIRSATHLMWKKDLPKLSLKQVVKQKVIDLLFVIGIGSLLLASFGAEALLQWGTTQLGVIIPLGFLNIVIVYILVALALMLIIQFLTPIHMHWKVLRNCSLFGALVYVILSSLLSWYLTQFAPQSAYAAAGSIVVLLLWINYNAQVFFFLMEIMKVIHIDLVKKPELKS